MTDRRLVLVIWLDACSVGSSGRWVSATDLDNLQPVLAQSVGWIYRETPEDIVLFSHDCVDDLGGEICIPRGCIKEIRELV